MQTYFQYRYINIALNGSFKQCLSHLSLSSRIETVSRLEAMSTQTMRELPLSQYNLNTYLGRVRHAADLTDPRYVRQSIIVLNPSMLDMLLHYLGHFSLPSLN